jgi:uncharacterized protein YcbK (DUF882 family)
MGDLSPHFSTHELACHDCGICSVAPALLEALEQLRALGPEPIYIDDACRCVKHNSEVGGVSKSEHLFDDAAKRTEAADLRIGVLSLREMYERALQVPAFVLGGIGLYDTNFIHLDVRHGGPARWARVNGKYVAIEALLTP